MGLVVVALVIGWVLHRLGILWQSVPPCGSDGKFVGMLGTVLGLLSVVWIHTLGISLDAGWVGC